MRIEKAKWSGPGSACKLFFPRKNGFLSHLSEVEGVERQGWDRMGWEVGDFGIGARVFSFLWFYGPLTGGSLSSVRGRYL